MILAPHCSGEAPAVNVARFVPGFAVLAEALRVKRGAIHGEVWPNAVHPGHRMSTTEDGGVTVHSLAAIVIATDVSWNSSGEKAFKAFLGACRHGV